MQYQITSDNIDISKSMEALAMQKAQKIEEKLVNIPDGLKSLRIVMNSLKDEQFEVKIRAVAHGKEYFVTESAYTLEHALVAAVENVLREMQKDKIVSREEDWKDARDAKHFDSANISE